MNENNFPANCEGSIDNVKTSFLFEPKMKYKWANKNRYKTCHIWR